MFMGAPQCYDGVASRGELVHGASEGLIDGWRAESIKFRVSLIRVSFCSQRVQLRRCSYCLVIR